MIKPPAPPPPPDHDAAAGLPAPHADAASTPSHAAEPGEGTPQQRHRRDLQQRLMRASAHEFNNLLTAILAHSDALLYELHETDSRRIDVDEIRTAAERASGLVRRLLSFGYRPLRPPVKLDLNEVLRELEHFMAAAVGGSITVRYYLDGELRPVIADPGLVEQVFVDVLMEQLSQLPARGNVAVDTANVVLEDARAELLGLKPGRYARVAIADDRPLAEAQRALQAFEAADPSNALLAARTLAVHGGCAMAVELGEPAGLRVDLFLPAAPTPSGEVSAEQAWSGSEVVLVVEDDPVLRRMAGRILREHGYNVLVARDGEHAIGKATLHPTRVDILITDIVMPRMDGAEVAARLMEDNPELRVLFTSGYPDRVPEQLGQSRSVAFLPKPYTRNQLLSELRCLLDG